MCNKLAEKLESLANGLQKTIDEKRRPMTQNPTPKRMREFNSRLWEADNLERGQRAMRALAAAHRAGNVPSTLTDLKTKAEILPLVHKGLESGGYYDVIPSREYRDKSPRAVALQELMEGAADRTTKQADAERERQEKIRRLENELRFCDIPGFFPTPRPVIEQMLSMTTWASHHRFLEPSAGKGDIAEVIKFLEPNAFLDVIEVSPRLCEILGAKELHHHRYDFMEWNARPQRAFHPNEPRGYDRILMNPPFERGQDAEHIRHAFDLLAPRGELVSVMSTGPFYRSDRKSESFREWLGAVGGKVRELPEGAFAGVDAFRRTGVRCCLVAVSKN